MAFSASENGVLLYRTGGGGTKRTLVWLDRLGKQLAVASEPQRLSNLALSPDGKRVAYSINSSELVSDIFLQDFERRVPERFTFGAGISQDPVWSPDGSYFVFDYRPHPAPRDLYKKPANSAGKEELLLHAGINAVPDDISRDGKLLAYSQDGENSRDDLWLLPLQGDRKPQPYLNSPYAEILAQFSPVGKWMAYASDKSGQFQVYVQSIPPGVEHQISTMGGSRPRWRRDGAELFYVSADGKMMAVRVRLGRTTFDSDAPRPLFEVRISASERDFGYQPSGDGQKFLAVVPEGKASTARPVTVWLNWQAGSKK